MKTSRVLILVILLLGFLSTGCTTLNLNNYTQKLKVSSSPEGAEVFFEGEKVGKTPGYIRIRRKKSARLELKKEGYPTTYVQLDSKYRWTDSFVMNLIFTSLAPAGWLIDYATGTSWNYDPLDNVVIDPKKDVEWDTSQWTIGIAPPQSDDPVASDQVANFLQEKMKKSYPKANVKNYNSSKYKFLDYEVSNLDEIDRDVADDLYYDLGITHLLTTELVGLDHKSPRALARLQNVYTGRKNKDYKIYLDPEVITTIKPTFWERVMRGLTGLVPNTLTFDLQAANSFELEFENGAIAQGDYQASSGFFGEALKIISSFGLTSLRPYKARKQIGFVFRFVPLFQVGYGTLRFKNLSGIDETTFDWYKLNVGIGPQLGLESHIGYFYLNFIPAYNYSYINYDLPRTDVGDGSVSAGRLIGAVEVGYSIFATRRLNISIFAKTVFASPNIWTTAFEDATNTDIILNAARDQRAGISLGFYFPEAGTWVSRSQYED